MFQSSVVPGYCVRVWQRRSRLLAGCYSWLHVPWLVSTLHPTSFLLLLCLSPQGWALPLEIEIETCEYVTQKRALLLEIECWKQAARR